MAEDLLAELPEGTNEKKAQALMPIPTCSLVRPVHIHIFGTGILALCEAGISLFLTALRSGLESKGLLQQGTEIDVESRPPLYPS